jgi:hypothetical protein
MTEPKEHKKSWDAEKDEIVVVEYQECSCGADAQVEPHTCPFQADVNHDSAIYCTCCSGHEYQCAMDV